MTKFYADVVFDDGLRQIQLDTNWSGGVNALKMALLSGSTELIADAQNLHPTGKRVSDEIAMTGTDLTIGDKPGGEGGGREVTVVAKTGTVTVSLPVLAQGTATAGTSTTLTDSGQSWGTTQFIGKVVTITSGTGSGQPANVIVSHTPTILTVTDTWTTPPDATSVYEIAEDLHYCLYDDSRLLYVSDETTNQGLTSGNPLNFPQFQFGMTDPV